MIDLNKREKRLLIGLGVVLGVVVIYFAVITPILSMKDRGRRDTESNITRLNNLEKIYEQYRTVKQEMQVINSQLAQTKGITTIIEENAQSTNIINKKSYTRDRPTIVQGKYKKVSADVKFEGIDITSLLNFIYKMENSGMLIQISYLRLNQTIKGRSTYDATITFNSLTSQ